MCLSPPYTIFAGCLACLGLIGCGAQTVRPAVETHVAYRAIDSGNAPRYELADEETATIPTQIRNDPPRYPPALIDRHIAPVAVRAKVVIDTRGEVSAIYIKRGEDSYPGEFDDAVRTAVSAWRYAPLRFQQFEDVLDAQGNTVDARLVKDEARPFSLDYEFSFEIREGKPVVSNRAARTQTP